MTCVENKLGVQGGGMGPTCSIRVRTTMSRQKFAALSRFQ